MSKFIIEIKLENGENKQVTALGRISTRDRLVHEIGGH